MNMNTAMPQTARDPEGRDMSVVDRNLVQVLDELERESALSQYVQVLWRRRWIILATVIAGLLIALIISWSTVRLYRATTSLQISREAEQVVDVKGVEPASRSSNNEFYPTQYGLLKSKSLAEAVVKKLRLDRNPTFMFGFNGKEADMAALSAMRREAAVERAVKLLRKNLTVTPVRNSSLVDVSFDAPDPELAKRVTDALAEAFIASNLSRRFESSAYARTFLEDEIAKTRAKLEESEQLVVTYADQQKILNFEGSGESSDKGNSGQSLLENELAAVTDQLVVARGERIAAQAKYDQANRSGARNSPEAMGDSVTTQLKTQKNSLEAEYSRLSAVFKPDYPQMLSLKSQIANLESQIRQHSGSIMGSLAEQYNAALQREKSLSAQAERLKGDMLDTRRRSIQYNIYKRDADTNRVLYDGLLQRYKEIGIAGGIGTNNVAIVDRSTKPNTPFTPRTSLNLILGLLVGLLVGGALAFLIEQLDESILAPHDLEKKLGVPLLGAIPKTEGEGPAREALDDPKSDVTEAYRSVQAALQFTTSHGVPRSILLTSAKASEGKSTSAFALARNLAGRERKVLLIDGDMRNPSLHKFMGVKNTHGFSDLLAGATDLKALVHKGPVPDLTLLMAGPPPPNPAELLAVDGHLAEILSKLNTEFDHIIIDGPPVMGLADSPLMASQVEGTVFVIAAVETRAKMARIALRRLVDVRAHIVGAVLTKFAARHVGYEYGYDYDYGREQKGGLRSLFNR